ncbi:hypothetical protein [Rhizobium sp. CECT 9324]|uniref:hypothetical protein n=1 Tax=Rhizobium sp. CECT 9324 TaxID=2845820 RepID=UPI001E654EB2|nr:hypothetical protein [Rhizobium sp. CECT 9324]CAH0343714.1 hypothetical protein RHI9324_05451 [Rhizobium sp. CECT 9324]
MLDWLRSLLPSRKAEPKPVPEAPAPKPEPVDIYFVYRPLFDLLGHSEGTDRGDGYNETLGYGIMLDGKVTNGAGPDVVLTDKTLKHIDELQTAMLRDPDNKRWNSSAIGRYQVVRTTLRKVRKTLGLDDTMKFSKDLQDAIALHLLDGRGLSKYLSGSMTEDTFLNNMAKEWASIPTTTGTGYYGNQSKTPVTPSQVRAVFAEVKKRLHSK